MWEVVEHAEIAAPPRLVWRIVTDAAGHAEPAGAGDARGIRIDVVDEPTEFAWTSYPPLDDGETEDHQIEVHWWFRLAPSWVGTALEHGFRAPPPRGAEEPVRKGLVATLANVKTRAELSVR